MNDSRHHFTTDATADLLAEAHRIIANPRDGSCRTAEEWRKAAQYAVDTNGDDVADLEYYTEEQDIADGAWVIDEDQFWRSSSFAISREI